MWNRNFSATQTAATAARMNLVDARLSPIAGSWVWGESGSMAMSATIRIVANRAMTPSHPSGDPVAEELAEAEKAPMLTLMLNQGKTAT